jgi:hypothetical protein
VIGEMGLKGYFDLQTRRERSVDNGSSPRVLTWWPQYLALISGVAVQPFFEVYQQTQQWNIHGAFGRLGFAIIVGLIIFPSVYRGAFDPDKPIFLQLCAIFAAGMGWQSLLHTTLTAAQRIGG